MQAILRDARRPRGAERLHPGRPRAALAGPEEGVRRDGPHRARPGGAGCRRPPLRAARHHGPHRRDPRPPRAQHQQRLPCGRRQPAPQHLVRPARRGRRPAGAPGLHRDHGRVRRGRRQHHRRARRRLRQAGLHAARSSTPKRSARCARCGGCSIRPSAPTRARSCPSTPAASGARRRGRAGERRRPRPASRAARHRRRRARPRGAPARHPRLRRRALAGLPAGARGRLEDPDRGPGHLAPGRRAGRPGGEHAGARPGGLGEPGRPGGDRAGRHAARGAPAAAGRRGDVARARSAGPARAEPRLDHGDGHRRPAPPRLRSRCATTCSAAPSPPATGGW